MGDAKGVVGAVEDDGQADELGVAENWQFLTIDGDKFTKQLLETAFKNANTGKKGFTATMDYTQAKYLLAKEQCTNYQTKYAADEVRITDPNTGEVDDTPVKACAQYLQLIEDTFACQGTQFEKEVPGSAAQGEARRKER